MQTLHPARGTQFLPGPLLPSWLCPTPAWGKRLAPQPCLQMLGNPSSPCGNCLGKLHPWLSCPEYKRWRLSLQGHDCMLGNARRHFRALKALESSKKEESVYVCQSLRLLGSACTLFSGVLGCMLRFQLFQLLWGPFSTHHKEARQGPAQRGPLHHQALG